MDFFKYTYGKVELEQNAIQKPQHVSPRGYKTINQVTARHNLGKCGPKGGVVQKGVLRLTMAITQNTPSRNGPLGAES